MTPLHLAAQADCSLCVKIIFEYMGRRDEQDNFLSYLAQRDAEGRTPLILAVLSAEKVQSERGSQQEEAYHSKSSGYVVETLLNLGSDPQEVWKGGIRPLHIAAERGNIHILAAILLSLIEQTMNFQLNAETDSGEDPLDIAIANNHLEIVAMLVQSGLQIKRKHFQLAHDQKNQKIS